MIPSRRRRTILVLALCGAALAAGLAASGGQGHAANLSKAHTLYGSQPATAEAAVAPDAQATADTPRGRQLQEPPSRQLNTNTEPRLKDTLGCPASRSKACAAVKSD